MPNDSERVINLAAHRKVNVIDRRVGQQVKRHRERVNLSQSDLGAYLGVSYQQIQKYELGINHLSAGQLFQLCKLLEIGVDELFVDT